MTGERLCTLLNNIPDDLWHGAVQLPPCWTYPGAEPASLKHSVIVSAVWAVEILARAIVGGMVETCETGLGVRLTFSLREPLLEDYNQHGAEFDNALNDLVLERTPKLKRAGLAGFIIEPPARVSGWSATADVEENARQALEELLAIAKGETDYVLGRCEAPRSYDDDAPPCERWFVNKRAGRPRKYCSGACQVRAYHKRL